jgi:hypothetical protein
MREIKAWISNNNALFMNKEECAAEDGLVRCKNCNSRGLEKYEHVIPYPAGLPDSGWVPDTIEIGERTCSRCNGLGYVKMNPEDDKDYQQYLKLKKKYEGKY